MRLIEAKESIVTALLLLRRGAWWGCMGTTTSCRPTPGKHEHIARRHTHVQRRCQFALPHIHAHAHAHAHGCVDVQGWARATVIAC